MKYWFRPKKFFGYFASYYPSSIEGYAVSLVLLVFLVVIFRYIDVNSHSVSDTLINFAPFLIIAFLTFDIFCFRKGEYPSWWKKKE